MLHDYNPENALKEKQPGDDDLVDPEAGPITWGMLFGRQLMNRFISYFAKLKKVDFCSGCNHLISFKVCWCGAETNKHDWENHSFVPWGCTCYYADSDKRKRNKLSLLKSIIFSNQK